jgi:hypothetical protein
MDDFPAWDMLADFGFNRLCLMLLIHAARRAKITDSGLQSVFLFLHKTVAVPLYCRFPGF